jgi:hypothetical protein
MKWMRTNSQNKKGFKLLPGNNHVPKGIRLKLPREATMFSREKEVLLFKDMIVP